MASVVDIWNRALQKLGAQRVTSTTEDSVMARACNACYEILRDAELAGHPWAFNVQRASLAAESTSPDWGRGYAYVLPSDFLSLRPEYPEDINPTRDWMIEGGSIYTNSQAPLYLRYGARITDTSRFPALFVDVLAARMASEMCEELTQSNSKKAAADADYDKAIARAKKQNAIERGPLDLPEDEWITCRV